MFELLRRRLSLRKGSARSSTITASAVKPVEVAPDVDTRSDEWAIRLALRELWEAYRLQDATRLRDIVDDTYFDAEDADKKRLLAGYLTPDFTVRTAMVDERTVRIILDGKRATVTYKATTRQSSSGHQVRIATSSTDVFIKRGSTWRLYQSTNTDRFMDDDI